MKHRQWKKDFEDSTDLCTMHRADMCLPKKDLIENRGDLIEILKHPIKAKIKEDLKENLSKSELPLEKGALKNAGIALGMTGALVGGAHSTDANNRSPANISHVQHKTPSYDHKKMLRAIASVESSGGKNVNHGAGGGPIHGSERAFGKYGQMPETIRETIKGHKDLASKHGKALVLKGDQFHRYMQDNKSLEDIVADRHLAHLEHRLGQDPSQLGFAWLNGAQGTLNAKNSGKDINGHWHAKKVKEAYDKEK